MNGTLVFELNWLTFRRLCSVGKVITAIATRNWPTYLPLRIVHLLVVSLSDKKRNRCRCQLRYDFRLATHRLRFLSDRLMLY